MLKSVKLADYTPYPYSVDHITLDILLNPQSTIVTSELKISPNTAYQGSQLDLILDGENIELISVYLDDILLNKGNYTLQANCLIIHFSVWEIHTLKLVTSCIPQKNLQLSGLYESSSCLVTQCEAQGFRRITYYPDRPDVLSRFQVTLHANQHDYPVLLANGNLVAHGLESDGMHWVTWDDPFLKPSYLFALVAGKLVAITTSYVTQSGKSVNLAIYAHETQIQQCYYALDALKAAMQWDEITYGCECDLLNYTLVAVDDFNSGAMENKGLNIFNSKYILADPETATDIDYQNILAVVGHEYFHNWSGNRVTCRDWFQLSLKEGFTIFREQQFMATQMIPELCRIEQVKRIRIEQFAQDASSMAHPVQPNEYVEIRNFYTVTIYEKGAEVIRMLQRIVGEAGFIQGAKAYFKQFDGQAVTIDDFVHMIATTNGFDATQFFHWYKHAGTPQVTVTHTYDVQTCNLKLRVTQDSVSPGNPLEKPLFYIPMAVSFLDKTGALISLNCTQALASSSQTEVVLPITQASQEFVFQDMPEESVCSLFRGFSAPVKYHYEYTTAQLLHLAKYDTDAVARWDATQSLIMQYFKGKADPQIILDLIDFLLSKALSCPGLIAQMTMMPEERYVYEMCPELTLETLLERYDILEKMLASSMPWLDIYQVLAHEKAYQLTPSAIAERTMKNISLYYIASLPEYRELAYQQYQNATNMTDRLGALKSLNQCADQWRELAFTEFQQRFQGNPLVMDMWYGLQARCSNALEKLRLLWHDPHFNWHNPNRLYATIGVFSRQNLRAFHALTGEGYQFLAEAIARIDTYNPEVAARLAEPFTRWQRLDQERQAILKTTVRQLINSHTLSSQIQEIIGH